LLLQHFDFVSLLFCRLNNCVGWRNYPYFLRFLFYMWSGCMFVVALSAAPFIKDLYRQSPQRQPTGGPLSTTSNRPPVVDASTPAGGSAMVRNLLQAAAVAADNGYRKLQGTTSSSSTGHTLQGQFHLPSGEQATLGMQARLTLCFVICVAVGMAVAGLFAWHIYLVSSNQTSIEYLGNRTAHNRMKLRGKVFRNPYDLGWRRNWQTVFGTDRPILLMLAVPTYRLPPGDGVTFQSYR
jgi:DHHC palmitoyltransferase